MLDIIAEPEDLISSSKHSMAPAISSATKPNYAESKKDKPYSFKFSVSCRCKTRGLNSSRLINYKSNPSTNSPHARIRWWLNHPATLAPTTSCCALSGLSSDNLEQNPFGRAHPWFSGVKLDNCVMDILKADWREGICSAC